MPPRKVLVKLINEYKVLRKWAYRMEYLSEIEIQKDWNAQYLNKYYQ